MHRFVGLGQNTQVLATLCRSIEKRDDGLTQRTRESVDVDKMDEL